MEDRPPNIPSLSPRTSLDVSNTTSKASPSLTEAFATSGRVNSPTSNAPKAILSCDFCRHRKTKCDKAEGGCSNCKRAGIKCNMPTRQRLPRGRNGGRTKVDAELKARVGRLENLVRSLGGNDKIDDAEILERALAETNVQHEAKDDASDSLASQGHKTSRGSDYGRYLGGVFWTSLSDEVAGLKEILDDETDQEAELEENSRSTPSASVDNGGGDGNFTFVLCTADGMAVSPETMEHPPKFMRAGLCDIYLRAVDPMLKLIHRPSLSSFLKEDTPYLDYPQGHPAPEALSFAVYLAAIGSQRDDECRANFGQSKMVLASRYKLALEAALSRADFLVSNDLTTLSAFIILIIFTRVFANDRRPWTLIALAFRIAQAQGLHREGAQPPTSLFWREMRRRVWNSLTVLDAQAAGDRGTAPLLVAYGPHPLETPAPMNINDSDLTFFGQEELIDHDGITDCTMTLICRNADDAATKLVFNAGPDQSMDDPFAHDWETRKEFAVSWRKSMHEKFSKHCDPSQKLHQILVQVIEVVSLDLLLGAIRPLHKHPKASTPRVSGDYILEIASSALERAATMLSMPTFQEFLWFGRQYNQWHAISVMLAELCIHTHGPAVDRAWAILDSSLEFYKEIIADSEKGMLWRPIEKLLRRAREKRSEALRERGGLAGSVSGSSSKHSIYPTLDHKASQSNNTSAPPQTANEAIAFTPYLGPPPDGTALGLSPSEIETARQANGWQLPAEMMKVDMASERFDQMNANINLTSSPDDAWQNWGSFTEGLQQDESLFPMQMDQSSNATSRTIPGNSPFPWMGFTANFTSMPGAS